LSQALLLDGKAVACAVRAEVKARVEKLGRQPGLGIILAGDFEPSQVYVNSKARAGEKAGIKVQVARFPAAVGFAELAAQIEKWNRDRSVSGVIVQLPVPAGLDSDRLVDLVDPAKDVDGLTSTSFGMLLAGKPGFVPATPSGIIELLRRSDIAISGRRVVIVGRGNLVGRPLAALLLLRGERGDATVTVCHSRTPDLAAVCRTAEILVVAAGRAGLITADMVSEGAVVVDAGTNSVGGRLVGDVDLAAVSEKASAITPVPGGVGPMTVAMLLANVVTAAERAQTNTKSTKNTKTADSESEAHHQDTKTEDSESEVHHQDTKTQE